MNATRFGIVASEETQITNVKEVTEGMSCMNLLRDTKILTRQND